MNDREPVMQQAPRTDQPPLTASNKSAILANVHYYLLSCAMADLWEQDPAESQTTPTDVRQTCMQLTSNPFFSALPPIADPEFNRKLQLGLRWETLQSGIQAARANKYMIPQPATPMEPEDHLIWLEKELSDACLNTLAEDFNTKLYSYFMESRLRHVLSPIAHLDAMWGPLHLKSRLEQGKKKDIKILQQHLRGLGHVLYRLEQGLFVSVAVLGALAACVLIPVASVTALCTAVLASVCLVACQLCTGCAQQLHYYKTSQNHYKLLRGLAHITQLIPSAAGLTLQGLGWLALQCTPDCCLRDTLKEQLQALKSIDHFDTLLNGVMTLPTSVYVMGLQSLSWITKNEQWQFQANQWMHRIMGDIDANCDPKVLGRTFRQAAQTLLQNAQDKFHDLRPRHPRGVLGGKKDPP